MSSEEEEDLITRLEQLQITRREIAREEERILQRLRAQAEASQPGAAPAAEEQQRRTRDEIGIGDHVCVTDNTPHAGFRRATTADRAAIVDNIANTGRIYFRTCNGTRTWRTRNHLHILSPQERANIEAERRR